MTNTIFWGALYVTRLGLGAFSSGEILTPPPGGEFSIRQKTGASAALPDGERNYR
jgi:hypothetical protein